MYQKICSYNTICSYIPYSNLGHLFYRTWKQFTWRLSHFKMKMHQKWQHINLFCYLDLWHFQGYLKSFLIHRGLFFSIWTMSKDNNSCFLCCMYYYFLYSPCFFLPLYFSLQDWRKENFLMTTVLCSGWPPILLKRWISRNLALLKCSAWRLLIICSSFKAG